MPNRACSGFPPFARLPANMKRSLSLILVGLLAATVSAEEGNPVAQREFEIDISQDRKKRYEKTDGKVYSRIRPYSFELTIETRREEPATNLKAEYRILVERGLDVGHPRRDDGEKVEAVAGSVDLTKLVPREEMEFETKTVEIHKSSLDINYYFEGNVVENSKDDLIGIWVRIYDGDTLLAEAAKPSSLPRKYRWKDGKPED